MTNRSSAPTSIPLLVAVVCTCTTITLLVAVKGGPAENAMRAIVILMSLVLVVLLARTARAHKSGSGAVAEIDPRG